MWPGHPPRPLRPWLRSSQKSWARLLTVCGCRESQRLICQQPRRLPAEGRKARESCWPHLGTEPRDARARPHHLSCPVTDTTVMRRTSPTCPPCLPRLSSQHEAPIPLQPARMGRVTMLSGQQRPGQGPAELALADGPLGLVPQPRARGRVGPHPAPWSSPGSEGPPRARPRIPL